MPSRVGSDVCDGGSSTSTVIIGLIPAGAVVGALAPKLKLPRPRGLTTPVVESSVTESHDDQMGAAAAAPADDTQGEGVVTDAGLLFACPKCQHAFGSTRGLSLHWRRAHPTEYHAQNVPVARQKARWDHKELLILARTEIIFRRWGVRNINQRLVQITPGRTLEAIKRVRKSTRYRELLASIEQREADSSELLLEQTPSDPSEGAPDDLSNDTTPASPDSSVEWAGPVRDAIYHLGVPDGIDIDAISPGKPTIQTRAMLDSEYAWWLPPLAGPNGRPPGQRSGAPRVWTGQPVYSARANRKAA